MNSSFIFTPVAGVLLLVAMSGGACGSAASNSPPPHAATPVNPDGGLPPPPPSKEKGVFVPSDTGLGAQPTGAGQTTGTNGRAMAPTLGSPGN